MTSPQPWAGSGSVIDGRYQLDGPLGAGAVGTVHRATHLRLHRTFALKLLKPAIALDPLSQARFRREAQALGRLRHPNIVAVTDSGTDPETGAPYLVMELLDGVPLSEILEREGPLPFERALPILEAIAAALDTAHGQGILHRDLKPGNVLLCGSEVKVLDFGLAEIAGAASQNLIDRGGPEDREASLTATDDLLGTPLYIAPELIGNIKADRASDLYSFAVIAYELLAGRPPFQGSTAEVLAGHLGREPARPEALSPEIWEALRPALAKDPALRPATAREIVRRLRAGAGRERIARWRRAEIPRRAAISALLAATLSLAALLLPSDRWSYDLRIRAAPSRAPDPRILLITLDDGSPDSLANRGDEIGGTLERVFAAGARGIGIDVVLHNSWNRSEAFSNLVLRHPESLALAAFSREDGKVEGIGCLSGLTAVALGPRKVNSLFGFVNLDADPDGRVRHGRLGFRDRHGNQRPSWAARAAGMLAPLPAASDGKVFWIDHRTNPAKFARLPWRDVPRALAEKPWIFRDRLVLVGGDLEPAVDDVHRVPHRREQKERVSGLILQARLVDTLVAGLPVRESRKTPFLAGAALWISLASVAALLARRPAPFLAILLGGLTLYLGLSITVFLSTGLLLPVTPILLPTLGALALALILRRALPAIPRSPTE